MALNPNTSNNKRQQAKGKTTKQVNIPRTVTDAFYRYKMPEMLPKVEGRGNGIKTVITNMSDVARALQRPPSYITKFFGFEFGTITTIDDENDRYVVNGNHDLVKLAQSLDLFISRFCLCKKCQLPETSMKVTKSSLELRCSACGESQMVNCADRIGTFILKNPPAPIKKGTADKGETKAKTADPAAGDAAVLAPSKSNEDVTWYTNTSAESVRQRREELLSQMASSKAASLFAVQPKADATTAATPASSQSPPLPNKVASPPLSVTDLEAALEEALDEDKLDAASDLAPTSAQLRALQKQFKLSSPEMVKEVFNLIFGEDIRRQVSRKAVLLQPFTEGSPAGQAAVLDCLLSLCCRQPGVIATLADVLNGLYKTDAIEEEAVLQWGEGLSARAEEAAKPADKLMIQKVKVAAQPFIDWLKTAEEESEGEE